MAEKQSNEEVEHEMLTKMAQGDDDASFRAAIAAARAETGPRIPHAQVRAQIEALLSKMESGERHHFHFIRASSSAKA